MGHILNIKIPQQKVFFDIVVGLGFVENLFLVILLTFISSYCCTELKVRYTKEKKSNLILLREFYLGSQELFHSEKSHTLQYSFAYSVQYF